jgi:MHS family proline/betaine transporter-like MFS transporter
MESLAPTALPEQPVSRRQIWIATGASVFGWSLDLFDFFMILYLVPTIGPLFFPSSRPTLSLAAVYGAFAVSLLMRPAGAALFGSYADRHGRKRAMTLAVISVGVVTALMGALPTVAQVGLLASALFVALRLIQGIFVGGVQAAAGTIGLETVSARWRGLLSGTMVVATAGLAGLVISAVFYAASSLYPGPEFARWGWRVMFFCGLFSSLLGIFIFRSLEESPLWSRLQVQKKPLDKAPLQVLLSARYRRTVLANLAVAFGGAAQYYLTSGYLPTFLAVINHLPKADIASILTLTNVLLIGAGAIAGHLSEIIGRKRFFLGFGLLNLVALPMLYRTLAQADAHQLGKIVLLTIALGTLANVATAPILIFLNERFPTEIRATGTAVCWTVGFALGGMTPTFATALAGNLARLPHLLLLFLGFALAVFVLGAAIVPETRGQLE